jgi:hypothetical protein
MVTSTQSCGIIHYSGMWGLVAACMCVTLPFCVQVLEAAAKEIACERITSEFWECMGLCRLQSKNHNSAMHTQYTCIIHASIDYVHGIGNRTLHSCSPSYAFLLTFGSWKMAGVWPPWRFRIYTGPRDTSTVSTAFTGVIDTKDYLHGIGNTPTHSIEIVLFQCSTF